MGGEEKVVLLIVLSLRVQTMNGRGRSEGMLTLISLIYRSLKFHYSRAYLNGLLYEPEPTSAFVHY